MPQIVVFRVLAIVLLTAVCGGGVVYAQSAELLTKHQLLVDRFGPVLIGMTPNEATKKLGVPLTLGRPPDEDDVSCHYVYPEGKFEDIGFMIQGGRITRIDIYSKTIMETHGIRIGDDESRVKKSYPGKIKETPHPYIGKEGKYLTVELKPGYAFVFETENGRITTFRAGTREAVQYIEGCL